MTMSVFVGSPGTVHAVEYDRDGKPFNPVEKVWLRHLEGSKGLDFCYELGRFIFEDEAEQDDQDEGHPCVTCCSQLLQFQKTVVENVGEGRVMYTASLRKFMEHLNDLVMKHGDRFDDWGVVSKQVGIGTSLLE